MSNAVINVQPWLKFTATTVGRDKIYRAVQYFSRFLAWYLLRQGSSKETVARFNNLKKTLALSRKRTVNFTYFRLVADVCNRSSGTFLTASLCCSVCLLLQQ